MRRCDKCNLDVPSGTVLTSLCVDEAAHHLVEHEGNIARHCNKCNVEVLSGSVLESVCVDGVAHTLVKSDNDVRGLQAALRSPLISPIPIDRCIPDYSAMSITASFQSVPGREAAEFVRAFDCFEEHIRELKKPFSERAVLRTITSLTGVLWQKLAALVDMEPALTYSYGKKGVSEENVYLNNFLVLKGTHKKDMKDSHHAGEALAGMVTFYPQDYGTNIAFLSVYAAAGDHVQFGLVEASTKKYYQLGNYDITTPEGCVKCFVMAINVFRLIRTMAPYIPHESSTTA
eukprot:gene11421-13277_t